MPDHTPAELDELVELVEPPKQPLRCSDDQKWNELHELVHFEFPTEFVKYGKVYGTGMIDSAGYGLLIGNPLDPEYPKWLLKQSAIMRTRGDSAELRPTRFYPENDGVVPIGRDMSGDLLFYSNDGQVVSCPTGYPNDLLTYPHGLIEFLVRLFSGKLTPEFFPNKHLKKHKPVFKKRAWIR